MTIPDLPPVSYWRSPRPINAGVLYETKSEAIQNGEQLCEDLYSAHKMRAFGEACYRAGMERAAVIAEDTIEAEYEGVDRYGENCAAAIRAEAAKEAKCRD